VPNFISEDDIEQAILQKLHDDFGYALLNCMTADPDDLNDKSGRSDKREVIFTDRLLAAALQLNPNVPAEEVEKAIAKLTAPRNTMSAVAANRKIDSLIRDGIDVEYEDTTGRKQQNRIRIIDFDNIENNQFLAVSQLWIKGEVHYQRPDVILYVNGLPLVFIELKNSNIKLRSAFNDNLTRYKENIPQLFHANAFCILSNGLDSKVGSFTAGWEYFFNWLRVEDEKEKIDRADIKESGTSLERVVGGMCQKDKLLDYVENFIIFHNETNKIIAQNHQFIGVNRAIESFKDRKVKEGKLGVFWHTQGSGKSFSMIFYSRKIFRKFSGNYTFVIVTDRDDLDGQIYRNFLNTETVKKSEIAQPRNSKQLREYLGTNKRIVFTLIQKFRYDKGKKYPILSERDDIIVIVDEAHRTQYKTLAENMRAGLPNAQYLAFTGTPLLGKNKTNTWFGGYVSEYNFKQSMDDGATVPLFYEKRVPEVLIQNDDLSEEFYTILEDENLDEAQQVKLEKKFARETEVIKRDDRLELIAEDIVYHFPRRGYLGKGLVISLDKFTAVKMYDNVQRRWKEEIKSLMGQISQTSDEAEKQRLKQILKFMRETEMAVVISEEAGEDDKFSAQKLDVKPHRKKLNTLDKNGHDVEYKFKDANDPLRLAFVCAMWLTGFDAPSLSTLYVDKPMKDHTLMQTIARANRVTSHQIESVSKTNGEIVDYYNVFRNMKRALKDYALGGDEEEMPVQDKSNLFDLLDEAIDTGKAFLQEHDINIDDVLSTESIFKNIKLFEDYADKLLEKDEIRKTFNVYENTISSLYEACKPEILKKQRPYVPVFQYLRGVIESIIERTDIDNATNRISSLLDQSIVANNEAFKTKDAGAEYKIIQKGKTWDLSQIDFEKMKSEFKKVEYKNIEIADLKSFLEQKMRQMLEQNVTRDDFARRLQTIIDNYNSGGSSTENYFQELMDYAKDLKAEDERHIQKGLTPEELELYDLLKKEALTAAEEKEVKLAAKQLLKRLHEEKPKVLVQDWHRDKQTQIKVQSAVAEVLDMTLPDTYDRHLFKDKCDSIYSLIYDRAHMAQSHATHH
jgi:type I restriction enzyme R subunit